MKSFKRIICILLALVFMVALMSACGKGKDTAADSKPQTSSQEEIVSGIDPSDIADEYKDFDPYANIPESSKGVTVRYATWIDHYTTEGAVPLANFYNDTGIHIELYTVKQSGYVNSLMTKIASGDIPDVFISNEGDQAFPLTLQFAAPINKVSSVDLDDPRWDKTINATATIDGNVYMVNTIGTP